MSEKESISLRGKRTPNKLSFSGTGSNVDQQEIEKKKIMPGVGFAWKETKCVWSGQSLAVWFGLVCGGGVKKRGNKKWREV